MEADACAPSRPQVDLLEALELLGRFSAAAREPDVELDDFSAGGPTGVLHADAHRPRSRAVALVRPADVRSGVAEGGVGKAVAEGEQRCLAARVVPAVPDAQTLVVVGDAVDARPAPPACDWCLSVAARERDRQPAGGVDVAKQHGGDGIAVLLTGVPRLDHACHL